MTGNDQIRSNALNTIILIEALTFICFITYVGSRAALETKQVLLPYLGGWFVVSCLLSMQFWLPLAIPSRYMKLKIASYLLCIICLLITGSYFINLFFKHASRWNATKIDWTNPYIIESVLFTGVCMSAAGIFTFLVIQKWKHPPNILNSEQET